MGEVLGAIFKLDLLIGVVAGMFGGVYSGLIVARYTRFAELRTEVLRVIRNIDFVEEDGKIFISGCTDLSRLHLIQGDLFFLKHIDAGNMLSTLIDAINKTNMDASAGRIRNDQYEERYSKWQLIARTLSPQKSEIFGLGWRL